MNNVIRYEKLQLFMKAIFPKAQFTRIEYEYILDILDFDVKTLFWNDIALSTEASKYHIVALIEGQLQGNRYDQDAHLHISRVTEGFSLVGIGELVANQPRKFDYTVSSKQAKIVQVDVAKLYDNKNTYYLLYKKLYDASLEYYFGQIEDDNKRLEILSYYGVRAKLNTYFKLFHGGHVTKRFYQNMNQQQLADFISVSRPVLSMELKKMLEEKVE